MHRVFETLESIHYRPQPFAEYTARELWDDNHISAQMLDFHLDPESAPASRPHEFIDRSAAFIADRFDLGPDQHVGDFGCGPGLYATRLAETGATVTGVDFSRRSIAHARKEAQDRGLAIEYVHADYLDYRAARPFDLITLVYCDLCPLSPEQRLRLLKAFSDQLATSGSIFLDVFSLTAFEGREEITDHGFRLMHGFWAPGDYWGFQDTFKYEEERVVLDKYTIVEPHRTRTVYNWLQYFSAEVLASEFERAGLRIVEWYGDVAGAPADEGEVLAVVAEKNSC